MESMAARWSTQEILDLRARYPHAEDLVELAKSMGRTLAQVRLKARKMGLQRDPKIISALRRKATDKANETKRAEAAARVNAEDVLMTRIRQIDQDMAETLDLERILDLERKRTALVIKLASCGTKITTDTAWNL